MIVGVISDTHGLVRPEALAALAGVELILHAGDVGGRAVLEALRAIAPLRAVRGNNDRDALGASLPETDVVEVGGARLVMVHDVATLPRRLVDGAAAVVAGHSHRPLCERRAGDVLWFNPGSAGPRRFRLPIAVGRLHIRPGGRVDGEIVELAVG